MSTERRVLALSGVLLFALTPEAVAATSAAVPAAALQAHTAKALSTRGSFSCAIIENDTVQCWGHNSNGQLGDGTQINRTAPVTVKGLGTSPITQVSVGAEHACALNSTGVVKCWGVNTAGQLGDGTTTTRRRPVKALGLGTGVKAIRAGMNHTCAVTSTNAVKCWGLNHSGQLGDGSQTNRLLPTAVTGLGKVKPKLQLGYSFSCGVTSAGSTKCWGDNTYGQLGNGTTTLQTTPGDVIGEPSDVTAMGTGWAHICQVTSVGTVYCWGRNSTGQVGTGGNNVTPVVTAVPVPEITSGATGVALGFLHTCATVTARLYCWGSNYAGQQGNGTVSNWWTTEPIEVAGLDNVTAVTASDMNTCAIAAGKVYCWGDNDRGSVGDGTTIDRLVPTGVVGLS